MQAEKPQLQRLKLNKKTKVKSHIPSGYADGDVGVAKGRGKGLILLYTEFGLCAKFANISCKNCAKIV